MAMRTQRHGRCAERDGRETGVPKRRFAIGSKVKNTARAGRDRQPEEKSPLGRLDFDSLPKSLPRGARELREAQAEARRREAVHKGCSGALRHSLPRVEA